jgi:hypothetical protein
MRQVPSGEFGFEIVSNGTAITSVAVGDFGELVSF